MAPEYEAPPVADDEVCPVAPVPTAPEEEYEPLPYPPDVAPWAVPDPDPTPDPDSNPVPVPEPEPEPEPDWP